MRICLKSAIFLVLAVAIVAACTKRISSEECERQNTDNYIERQSANFYSEPAKVDSLFKATQSEISDSLTWYKLELYRGILAGVRGDTTTKKKRQKRVRQWCLQHEESGSLMALLYNCQGVELQLSGKLDSALAVYQKAFALAQTQPAGTDMIKICINLADANLQTGHMPTAANFYRRALFLNDSLNTDICRLSIYTGLGQVYMEFHNYDVSRRFFKEASRYLDKAGAYDQYLYHLSLGNCLYYEHKYDDALGEFAEARRLAYTMEDETLRICCQANMGEILLLQNRPQESRAYLEPAYDYVNVRPVSAQTEFYVRSLWADLAIQEGRVGDAEEFLSQPIDTTIIKVPRYIMLHYARLQRIAERRGDYKKAYIFQKKVREYGERIRNVAAMNSATELYMRYREDTTMLRQKLIMAEYERKHEHSRSFLMLGILLLVIALSATTFLFIYHKVRSKRQYEHMACRLAELRMKVVRNRVSPHYIFNVLGVIFPKFRSYPELRRPLDMLIGVIRGALICSEQISVSLSDEIALVEDFVKLHHFIHGEWPHVEWRVANGVPCDMQVLTMCLQLPVENALKHAFVGGAENGLVLIEIDYEKDCLHIAITDNGSGYHPQASTTTDRSTGNGLVVLARTIELLNRRNNAHIRFSISDRPAPNRGTCVRMDFPRNYNYNELKAR